LSKNPRRRIEAWKPSDSPHPPLIAAEDLKVILAAPGLRLERRDRRTLRLAVKRASERYLLYRDIASTRLVPARDARRLRAAASALDKALSRLRDDHVFKEDGIVIARSDLMAWAGDEEDRITPRKKGAPSGFERATNAVEEILWLRDRLQAAAGRVGASRGNPAGRPNVADSRREAVVILAPAYQKAFGKPMGTGRVGPAVRFLNAFFGALGDHPHAATLVKLIRSVRRECV
jgi:hypothetical protein